MNIEGGGIRALSAEAVILVPQQALIEAGFMRLLAADQTGQSKHTFQALAQTALLRFEDRELTPTSVTGTLRVSHGDQTLDLVQGVLIVRLSTGDVGVLTNCGQPIRRYLEAAHRYCTRWIRLDL